MVKKKRAALYARVSTAEQSLDPQLLQLREYARHAGYSAEEFTDFAMSGNKKGRPGLNRMMKLARERKLDVIVVAAFDRFARSVSHLVNAIEELDYLEVQFVSLREQIDSASPTGRAMFTMIAAIAQLERDIIIERTKQGLKAAKARGSQIGGKLRTDWDMKWALELRKNGIGIRKISKLVGTGVGTIYRYFARVGDPLKQTEDPA